MECGVVAEHYETPYLHPDIGTHPPGMALPRTAWVRNYRFCTVVGRFRSCLHKWGMAPSMDCVCGTEEQTVEHAVLHCPNNRPPYGMPWPDGSGWRDNRMTAQHLPWDLVQPSSRLNNSFKRWRRSSIIFPLCKNEHTTVGCCHVVCSGCCHTITCKRRWLFAYVDCLPDFRYWQKKLAQFLHQ